MAPHPGFIRFHAAQRAGSPSARERALAELRSGRKRSHWIWFVLPQLTDPVLRQRLEAVIAVIDAQFRQPGQSLENLMGSGLDAAKTVSSLTLFEAAGLVSAGALLDRIGRRCGQTLERLS